MMASWIVSAIPTAWMWRATSPLVHQKKSQKLAKVLT